MKSERNDRTMETKMYPLELVKELDKYIVGQRVYKETVAMSIYTQCYKNSVNPIMVIGPTGSGKSYLFKILKKSSLRPNDYTIMTTNISRLTEEGVHGQDIDDIFVEFKQLCEMEKNYEYRGLIHIDEIDKLVYPSYVSNENANRNSIIQHQLMQILDGGTIAGVPTKNILFVFSGAFHQLDELNKKEVRHNPIGFIATDTKEECVAIAKDTLRNDLLEVGFQREFLGRINQIVKLNALTEKELKAILLHPSRGVISKLKQSYASDGIDLVIEGDAIDGIIKAVVSENLGARSVSNIVETILNGAWFHCIANNLNQIVVDKEVIRGGKLKYNKVSVVIDKKEKKKIEKPA